MCETVRAHAAEALAKCQAVEAFSPFKHHYLFEISETLARPGPKEPQV
jgi:hypothetical protein